MIVLCQQTKICNASFEPIDLFLIFLPEMLEPLQRFKNKTQC